MVRAGPSVGEHISVNHSETGPSTQARLNGHVDAESSACQELIMYSLAAGKGSNDCADGTFRGLPAPTAWALSASRSWAEEH
jgi:hypothetical protein